MRLFLSVQQRTKQVRPERSAVCCVRLCDFKTQRFKTVNRSLLPTQTAKRWERAHVHEPQAESFMSDLRTLNIVVKQRGCRLGLLKYSGFSNGGTGSETTKPTRRTDTQRCESSSPHGNRREGRSQFLTYAYKSRHNRSSQTGFFCAT